MLRSRCRLVANSCLLNTHLSVHCGRPQPVTLLNETGRPLSYNVIMSQKKRANKRGKVRQHLSSLLKAVITAFPCISRPFLAVPLPSQPTVAIRSPSVRAARKERQHERPRRRQQGSLSGSKANRPKAPPANAAKF
eukprot:SAG22_NODE_155_length_17123_cov_37.528489_31_plen_136_part_00